MERTPREPPPLFSMLRVCDEGAGFAALAEKDKREVPTESRAGAAFTVSDTPMHCVFPAQGLGVRQVTATEVL